MACFSFFINLIEYGVSFGILKYKSLSFTCENDVQVARGRCGGGRGGGRPTPSTPPRVRVCLGMSSRVCVTG